MTVAYYQYFQYACLGLAILNFKFLKQLSLGLLLPLLMIVCVVETAAHAYLLLGLKNNYDIYKVWTVGAMILNFSMFFKLLTMNKWQRYLFLFVCLGSIIFMLTDLLILSVGSSMHYTSTLLSVEMFLLSCLLIAQLVMNDSHAVKLSAHPYFWFAAGLMLFSACHLITSGLHPYIRDNKLTLFGDPIYRTIGRMINVVLYISYSISIILCSRFKQILPASS